MVWRKHPTSLTTSLTHICYNHCKRKWRWPRLIISIFDVHGTNGVNRVHKLLLPIANIAFWCIEEPSVYCSFSTPWKACIHALRFPTRKCNNFRFVSALSQLFLSTLEASRWRSRFWLVKRGLRREEAYRCLRHLAWMPCLLRWLDWEG